MRAAPARWRALARQSRLALDMVRAEQACERARHQREIDTLRSERSALLGKLYTARAERDATRDALDTLRAERDALRVALDTMRSRLDFERETSLAREIAQHRAPAPEGRGACARCSCACVLDGGLCYVCAREQGGA